MFTFLISVPVGEKIQNTCVTHRHSAELVFIRKSQFLCSLFMMGIIQIHYVEVCWATRPSLLMFHLRKQRLRRCVVLMSAMSLYSEFNLAVSVHSKIYFASSSYSCEGCRPMFDCSGLRIHLVSFFIGLPRSLLPFVVCCVINFGNLDLDIRFTLSVLSVL
jgi:hypothetical protein